MCLSDTTGRLTLLRKQKKQRVLLFCIDGGPGRHQLEPLLNLPFRSKDCALAVTLTGEAIAAQNLSETVKKRPFLA